MSEIIFHHLSYTGRAEPDPDGGYHGRVDLPRDVVTFVADTIEGAEREFRESLAVYFELCAERGVPPEPPAPAR